MLPTFLFLCIVSLWFWLWLRSGVPSCWCKCKQILMMMKKTINLWLHYNLLKSMFIECMVEVGQANNQTLWKIKRLTMNE
jgi:hypothetical protein